MTREQAVELVNARLASYKRRDAVALARGFAEDAVVVSPMFATVQGRKAIEASYKSLFNAFPDWEMHAEEPIIDGNRIAQLFRVTATHVNDLFGLPGTGRRVEFPCMIIMRIENGMIAHERRIYDFAGVLMQIGILKGKMAK